MLRVQGQPWLSIILRGKGVHRTVLSRRHCILPPKLSPLWFTPTFRTLSSGRSCSTKQQELPKRRPSDDIGKPDREIEETRKYVEDLKIRPLEEKTSRTPMSHHAVAFEKALVRGTTKENFYEVVENFVAKDRTRRGHMEFLNTSMGYMEQFNLEKDLTAYNKLLDVFPRGRFMNKTLFDAIWAKQHPQSELALEILTKMEENVIKPNIDTYNILLEIFGQASQPVQKCRRLAYWFTKLEEMFPHPLPQQLPESEIDLSRLAFERMTKDPMDIVVYQYNADDEQEFIIGAQSAAQKKLLGLYDTSKPLYVEGPYFMWLRRVQKHYFTLKTDVGFTQSGGNTEGTVLAVCMTGSQDKEEALRAWIYQLQKENARLGEVSVVFNLQPSLQLVSTDLEDS